MPEQHAVTMSPRVQEDAFYRALLECMNEGGETFLRGAVRYLSEAVGSQTVFVAECADYPTTRMRILAEWDRGAFGTPREFQLAGTPCQRTIGDGLVNNLPDNLLDHFPKYAQRERKSYLGVPITDPHDHQVIGHIAFWDRAPLYAHDVLEHPASRAFVSRIGAELRRKRADDTLHLAAQTLAPTTGDAFFRTLVECLAKTLQVSVAFIAQCVDQPASRIRVLARWGRTGLQENFELALAGAPCERTVADARVTFFPKDLAVEFAREREQGFESYLGVPITDPSDGRVLAHIALFDERPMPDWLPADPLLQIFASRASAEIMRKRAEDELRASEARYRLLVENQTDMIAQIDSECRYCFVSPSFCACLGLAESALLGERFALQVHALDRDAFDSARAEANVPPRASHVDARVLTATGWRWIAWGFTAFIDDAGKRRGLVVAGRDVSERKQAEEQSRQHLRSLAHASRLASMGEMATTIAHEVNQPLTAVVTYSHACARMLSSGQPINDETLKCVTEISAQAERASQIIRHLRQFARKGDAERLATPINDLVEEVVQLVRPDARHWSIEIHTDLHAELPEVTVDAIQIQQVIVNLVRNAEDAINAAGCERREVMVSTRRGNNQAVEVIVEDSGPGFDDATAAMLFEPFYSTKESGMGIGLSISRSIAEAHGGRITASRASAGGARFTLELPAAPD